MNQVLLYSIAPQHMLNILNGHKTIEVRKRDLPQWAKDKLARGEKVIGYGYETLGKHRKVTYKTWENYADYYGVDIYDENGYTTITEGKGLVVVKFELSGSDIIFHDDSDVRTKIKLEKACLTIEQLKEYGKGKDLYAHHITNIQPVNMELGEFYRKFKLGEIIVTGVAQYHDGKYYISIERPPQSFQSVWVKS